MTPVDRYALAIHLEVDADIADRALAAFEGRVKQPPAAETLARIQRWRDAAALIRQEMDAADRLNKAADLIAEEVVYAGHRQKRLTGTCAANGDPWPCLIEQLADILGDPA